MKGTGRIIFKTKPAPVKTNNEPYWWGDVKLNVPYKVLDSYEKTLDGTSRHFFLIQEAEGSTNPPLIEIPLDNNFTYYNYSDPKGQLLKDSTNQYFDSQVLNS